MRPTQSLPLNLRLKLYKDSLELKRENLSDRTISKILSQKYKVRVPKDTIYRWTRKRNRPDGTFNKFIFKKSKELSYVIGVILGDGQLKIEPKQYHYRIKLRVKDKEFAEKFARCLQIILSKKTQCKIYTERDRTRGNRIRFVGEASSKVLSEYLGKSWITLLQFSKPYTADFLKGLFDSEGFTSISPSNSFSVKVGMANTNLSLLKVVKRILQKDFEIRSYIRITMNKGQKIKIWNSYYYANKNVYILMIGRYEDVKRFANKIGFTISRKKNKLEDAIILKDNNPENASEIWRGNYTKIGREWVKVELNSEGSPESSP